MLNKSDNRLYTIINNATKSSLIKSSGIYSISSFINASIPFLLLPLLTKYLSPSDFGIVSMFTIIIGFVMPFVGLNMEGAIARRYYLDKNDIPEYIGNCVIISVFSTTIVLILIHFSRNVLFKYTGVPPNWIQLSVILCFFQFLIIILLTLFQVNVEPLRYGSLQITQSLLNLSLSILLIIVYGMNWKGRIVAQFIASVSAGIFSLIFLISRKFIVFKLNIVNVRHAIIFGGGLIPHTIGAFLIVYTNRVFLTNMIGIGETGLYSTASQVGSIIGFITMSFNNAYVPWLYAKLNLKDSGVKAKIVELTYLYFGAIIISGFLFYLLTPFIFDNFINIKFILATKYLFWIILGSVFQGMYFMVANYISYAEKTYLQSLVTIIVGLTNIPITYFCIDKLGSVGAGVAFGVSYGMMFIFTWFLSSKIYKMPWILRA
jgi:O-antigen/teichoic acid export membrane protein